MRIFIEGSCLLKQRSGIGQFIKRLIEVYCEEYPEDKIIITGFKFFTQGKPDYPIKAGKNLEYRILRWFPGRIYNQLFKMGVAPPYDLLFRARPGDVFIFPNFVRFPMLYNRKSIVTIHDLSFIYYSQYTHPKNLPYMLKYVPSSIKHSQQIMTISKSSKDQIANEYKVQSKYISIVNPGVDASVFYQHSSSDISEIRRKYKLPDKYILYTATIEPRKNIAGILAAYESLPVEITNKYALVLAGGKGWQDSEIMKSVSKLQGQGLKIILTGYVLDKDLPPLYSGASLFVWPSHYEGFGIPLLEAMACGVPVITANNSSLPEVAGGAAILLDSTDTPGLALAMKKVLTNKKLREDLTKKGYKQITKFGWQSSAAQLKDAIRKL